MRHAPLPLVEAMRTELQTAHFGRSVRSYKTVPSTNALALQWGREDASEGSVVLAEYQTAGRGRHGRPWQAHAGRNLMLSVVLRPALPPEQLGLVTLAGGVAVAETIADFTNPLEPSIKWPNDVQLAGRKCCGMLLESVLGEARALVVLGIGLNVNQETFPPNLTSTATSLLLETGRPVPRSSLLAQLLLHLERRYLSLSQDGGASVRARYEAQLTGLGQPLAVQLTDADTRVQGTFAGINSAGALLMKTDEGLRTFHAGEVTTHPPLSPPRNTSDGNA